MHITGLRVAILRRDGGTPGIIGYEPNFYFRIFWERYDFIVVLP
jgi:hypothetical protein